MDYRAVESLSRGTSTLRGSGFDGAGRVNGCPNTARGGNSVKLLGFLS